jgi:hypothetical protein|tara:strand:- start:1718 stop:2797 length:1080 start_codon:yes stop_codon:yes gene_type:complete
MINLNFKNYKEKYLFFIALFFLILIILISTLNKPQSNTQLKEIDNSINKAINFLYENQLNNGEFKTYACHDINMTNCYFDSSPFITTFVLYSIKDVKNEKVDIITNKAINFLLNEQESGGIWRYWTSRTKKPIPPDLDDISTISHILKLNNISFEDNVKLILNNRNKENYFFTWILDKKNQNLIPSYIKHDVDCVVNSNVLLYLGENDPFVCSYINNAIKLNKSCSIYYLELPFFYMVSRAFQNNITCFKESKNTVIINVLSKQKKDGSFGNSLDTSLALNTLLNFGYYRNEIEYGINNLIYQQSSNGSWKRFVFFEGGSNKSVSFASPESYYAGSNELTTAITIEAMQKYLNNYQIKT